MLFAGYILTAIVAYLLGSIPTGFLLARARGIDIRTVGSGNMGATNVFRTLGKGPGIIVLLVDALKGFVACKFLPLAAKHFFAPNASGGVIETFAIIAGICAILGHNFTCWLNFKGGKGIATSAGVLVALFAKAFVVVLAVWILVAAVSRYVSLASIIAAIWLPIMVTVFFFTNDDYSARLIVISVLMAALAVYKHKSNIERLLQGTERRIGEKVSAEVRR